MEIGKMKKKIVVDVFVDDDYPDICSASCDGLDLKEAIRKKIAFCKVFSDDLGYFIELKCTEIDGNKCFYRCQQCLDGESEYGNRPK
jgi:hypothetical protein